MATEETAKRIIECFNRHDSEGYINMYAPNVVIRDPQYPEPLRGREAVRKDIEDFFAAFPDISFRASEIVRAGDVLAVEGSFTGTHQGPIESPGGTIQPTGRQVSMDLAFFVHVDSDGLVTEEHRYYDLMGMLMQLGQMQLAGQRA